MKSILLITLASLMFMSCSGDNSGGKDADKLQEEESVITDDNIVIPSNTDQGLPY